ncbi:hypothetical protein BDN71DRAFT_283514 [Pleurotus eryngii]|uniref:Uncharacterized protein n=1 Tax=Pleurotus eryngii TaxID=5323 RepID=A0A9P5ZPX0_PLEER|nr:hypothetical protein BDN71DRAFT_283514 [Pleurotus eryngii]
MSTTVKPPFSKLFDVVELHRHVLSHLSVRQLREYGTLSHGAFSAARSLLGSCGNIDRILSRFFPENRTSYFRNVQRATGTLVAGSSALQLLVRQTYINADLDLYVHRLSVGDLIAALEVGLHCHRIPTCKNSESANHDRYLACGVDEVQDWESPTGRVIQVITTHSSPVQTILRYHSTCVMNFVSASHAYSLYGQQTLEDFISLYTRAGEDVVAVREKYESRGWESIDYVFEDPSDTSEQANTDNAASMADYDPFPPLSRMVGDSMTWIMRLRAPIYPSIEGSNGGATSHVMLDSRELACRRESWALGYYPTGEAFVYANPDVSYNDDDE